MKPFAIQSKKEKRTQKQVSTPFFQAKLTVNQPGDKYEQEADRFASQVVNSEYPDSESFFKPQITPVINRSEQNERQVLPNHVESTLQKSAYSGSPLPQNTRSSMERGLGKDLSEVKIHQDSEAVEANRNLNANAFTYGNHIYFNTGKFSPDTKSGQLLLAHELTHVIQQDALSGLGIQRDEDETNADSSEEGEFEFDYNLLPPSLQFSLGQWMLEANTSQVAFQFSHGLMKSRFGYNYGGNLTLGTQTPSSSFELGFNPHSPALSLNLTEDRFRFGANADLTTGGFGINLGYGSKLLPMPFDLAGPVYGGWEGASGILGDIGNMQDPISFYQSHGDNIDSIMGAVKALQPLANESYQGFGAGLRFTYNPQSGVLIHAGVQWIF